MIVKQFYLNDWISSASISDCIHVNEIQFEERIKEINNDFYTVTHHSGLYDYKIFYDSNGLVGYERVYRI